MNLALAEMYVQGVSTRKVLTVLQKLVGPENANSLGCAAPVLLKPKSTSGRLVATQVYDFAVSISQFHARHNFAHFLMGPAQRFPAKVPYTKPDQAAR